MTGSGLPECDGVYKPSEAPEKVSESGTKSSIGYWNGKMAWDRADGKAARNPSLSYSNSYKSWRIARLDGHLAYTIVNDDALPTTTTAWDVYKKGVAPAPKIEMFESDPRFGDELPKNTKWIRVTGSGLPECDGVYKPSEAPEKVSESGTKSSIGYWNGKMAWDRADGKAARNPSLSYSNSYKSWRIARLDGHLAYTIVNDDALPTTTTAWDVYKKGVAPAPKIEMFESDPRVKPNVVFVLGGPGAGKGTMCSLAKNQLGWEHLSAGDLLRAERNDPNSKNGELINNYITEGKIVPVEITVNLIKSAMSKIQKETGHINFLIDGFPRSIDNYEGWVKVMGDDANVIFMMLFECPLSVLEQRILGRAKYSGRKDDNIESLRKRFETYKNETMPTVNIFESDGNLVKLDSSLKRTEVYELVKSKLAPYTDPAEAGKPLTELSEMHLGLRPFPKKKKKMT